MGLIFTKYIMQFHSVSIQHLSISRLSPVQVVEPLVAESQVNGNCYSSWSDLWVNVVKTILSFCYALLVWVRPHCFSLCPKPFLLAKCDGSKPKLTQKKLSSLQNEGERERKERKQITCSQVVEDTRESLRKMVIWAFTSFSKCSHPSRLQSLFWSSLLFPTEVNHLSLQLELGAFREMNLQCLAIITFTKEHL